VDHSDHVALLRDGVPTTGGVWADLGAGTGAFTLALADLLGPEAQIYAIDRDAQALRTLERTMQVRFPATLLHARVADYTAPLALPPLDGVVCANTLHFHRHKEPILTLLRGYLRPAVGRLLLVEYNIDHGVPWVPYPLPFTAWERLAGRVGFAHTRLLARRPSRFLREIYSAVSWDAARDGD
jgi:SAM-dependent methyltransferase